MTGIGMDVGVGGVVLLCGVASRVVRVRVRVRVQRACMCLCGCARRCVVSVCGWRCV